MNRRLSLVLCLATLLVSWVAGSAEAAFPGANGKIAYSGNATGNNEVYTMNPDGTSVTKLTSDNAFLYDDDPSWSPDGQKIVYEVGGYGRIYVVNADGSGRTFLYQTGADPAWSPDGSKIVFVDDAANGISVMNADGTESLPSSPVIAPTTPPGRRTARRSPTSPTTVARRGPASTRSRS